MPADGGSEVEQPLRAGMRRPPPRLHVLDHLQIWHLVEFQALPNRCAAWLDVV